MKQTYLACTCIVPFYNEGERIFPVLESLLKVPNISHIICIDDSSHDTTIKNKIKKKFPQVQLLSHSENKGKSQAIQTALKEVITPYVLLIDADLKNISPKEISHAISSMTKNPHVDSIIFRRLNEPAYIKFLRWDVLLSGEKIIKTADLKNIFSEYRPYKYELEYAENMYMMKHKKRVYWLPSSGKNTYKVYKTGIKGLFDDFVVHYQIVKYAGIHNIILCSLFFCRKKHAPKN